ncbi:phospholipase D-like domain-containing protein, partial [Pseudomonas aeruginosa]|uniref:phospholipase D-like domain-containing protein n=1 Tax=Pseudomonas aeruginosa TaxID=287 RepID=UPI002886A94F
YAMRASYDQLLSRGVRIFEWQGPMMHAKAVVVDREWASVGTYNLDHRSLAHNLEVNRTILDRPFAADAVGRTSRNRARSGARCRTITYS